MGDPKGILRGTGRICLLAMRAAAVPARAFDRAGRLLFGTRYSPEALMDVRFGSEEGILDVVEEGAEHGTIGAAEERMIEGVLRHGEIPVSGIMTPWSRVVSLREGMDAEEIGRIAGETGFSRYPVLSAGGAEVVGILAARSLFRREASPFRLERHLLKPVYVPESMKVSRARTLRPRSTAFFASRPAASSTPGFDVFVHDVIAAISTSPLPMATPFGAGGAT